jgi:hypothetical protein
VDVDVLRIVAAVANAVIAVNYAGLGIFICTRFDAAGPTAALKTFRWSSLTFFLLCSVSHVEEMAHILDGLLPVAYWSTWHYLGHIVVQAIAGSVGLVFGLCFVSIRIFSTSYYAGLLDRAIDEQAKHLAAMVRTQDVKAVAHEARIVADAAELIHRAMRGSRA